MNQITVIFTKNNLSPLSLFVRWALPRSRFAMALSSHCYVGDIENSYEEIYEADFLKGVRRINRNEALRNQKIVKTINYNVPNKNAGIAFLEAQCGKKYDLKGALGVGLSPERHWDEDDMWYCYELAAASLKASGRDVFENICHVTEIALMSLKP